jgi:putative tryptophan/tyrosine transport system substrate-binding protein
MSARQYRQASTLVLAIALTLAILAAPLALDAQQAGKVYTIGILSLGFQDSGPVWWEVFLEAMRELNYVQGRNLVVKFAFASNQPERLAGLAGDLVHAGVDVTS